VVHVAASSSRRAQRLSNRAEPPLIAVEGGSLRLALSDNHALPSVVNKELYGVDDVDELMKSALAGSSFQDRQRSRRRRRSHR
jgi:hypothetical protein